MIRIRVTRSADGLDLVAVGHAGYGARGEDPVCAGVSALLYGFVAYLEETLPIATAGDRPSPLAWADGDGWLRVQTHGMGGKASEAWAVVAAGLRLIAAAYPAHVQLKEFKSNKKENDHGRK